MIFHVYMDESGLGQESDNLILSAVVGRGWQWNQWVEDIYRLQKKAWFVRLHASEIFNELKKFGNEKNYNHVKAAISYYLDTLEFRIVAVLSKSDYQAIYLRKKFPRKGKRYSQYSLCFRYLLISIVEKLWKLHGRNLQKICFILEQGSKFDSEAQRLYLEYRSELKNKALLERLALGLVLEDNRKKESRHLFAPDAFAYDILKLSKNGNLKLINPKSKRPRAHQNKAYVLKLNEKAMKVSRGFAESEHRDRMKFGRQKSRLKAASIL